jgi:hypothetical protein
VRRQDGKEREVAKLVLGLIFALLSGYVLFVRLHFLVAPRLALYFPRPYVTLGAFFIGGLGMSILATVQLLRRT